MRARWLGRGTAVLVALLMLSACAPHSTVPPTDARARRAECRRARGRVVARAFGMTIGVAVVGVLIVAAAAAGASGSPGGSTSRGRMRRERRRADREYRRQVCSDLARPLPPRQVVAVSGGAPVSAPPGEQQLASTFVQAEGPVRSCFGDRGGTVHVDAVIDGPSGQIAGYDIIEGIDGGTRRCLDQALTGVRFAPFAGSMRVRWAVQLSAPANTPLAP